MMICGNSGQFDNLSNCARQLRELEVAHVGDLTAELSQTRSSLLRVLGDYTHTRFQFGRLLHAYRRFFKAERGWCAAAKVIGAAIDRDERTIFRIIDGYERAEQLAPILIEQMEKQQLDPAADKNADIIEELAQAPLPASREAAARAVTKAFKAHIRRRKAARQSTKKEPTMDFVHHVVSLFQERFARMPAEQAKIEMDRTLRAVATELGIEPARRTLLPRKPPHLTKAA